MEDLMNTISGITKLNNHNYQNWRSCIKSYLEGQDLWEVINGNDTKPPENDYTCRKWKVKAGKVMYVLKSTIEDELLRQIKDDDTPKMVWDNFASLFSKTNDVQLQYDTGSTPIKKNRVSKMSSQLYKLAKEGDVELLEGRPYILRAVYFRRRTQYGNNILHIAARAGHDKYVAIALQHHPSLFDQVNSQGDSPLLVAARFGHLEVVKELTKTATENGTNSSSRSRPRGAVGELVHHQPEQITRQVGMAPAAENDTNPSSSHPQSGAEEGKDDHPLEAGTIPVGIATALENQTNSGSSRSSIGEEIVDHQSEQGTMADSIVINMDNVINLGDMATAMEEGQVDHQSKQGSTAMEEGQVDHHSEQHTTTMEEGPVQLQLDELIPSHWRVTKLEQGNIVTITTALHEALRNGHEKVAQYLLELKPEMANFDNLAGESPLFLAAESCCELFMLDVLRLEWPYSYSTKGPDGLNALHAARGCSGKIISKLIGRKRDLMRQLDNRGKAAIHHAVEAEYWVLLRELLEADEKIALLPDADGYTPLLTASRRGWWKIFEFILEKCPESIEARDHKGQNALHLCQFGSYSLGLKFVKIPEMCELLNVGDDEGNTPLHVAVKQNHYVKAMLLTSLDSIDLGAVNKEGLTALDLCESDWKHLNQKRMMWFHLWRYHAPRGRRPNEHKVPVGGMKGVIPSPDEDLKPYINAMSVVAALVATLTFAAAFTIPGGYDTSPSNLGGATLIKKAAIKAFIFSDALAMCFSITVISLLWKAMLVEQDLQLVFINASVMLLRISLFATLVAFMSGIFAVIAPKALWLAILVCIVCSMVFCLLSPAIVQRSSLSIWFMPSMIARDIRRFIQWRCKRKRDQSNDLSLIQRRSSYNTYGQSNVDCCGFGSHPLAGIMDSPPLMGAAMPSDSGEEN